MWWQVLSLLFILNNFIQFLVLRWDQHIAHKHVQIAFLRLHPSAFPLPAYPFLFGPACGPGFGCLAVRFTCLTGSSEYPASYQCECGSVWASERVCVPVCYKSTAKSAKTFIRQATRQCGQRHFPNQTKDPTDLTQNTKTNRKCLGNLLRNCFSIYFPYVCRCPYISVCTYACLTNWERGER